MTELEYTENGWRKPIDTRRHHREVGWDYRGRGIYHFTLIVAERYPLFGHLAGTTDEPVIQLSEFGRLVLNLLRDEPRYYGERGYSLRILVSQVMPDHIHVVVQVLEPLPQSIGKVIRGFKSACSSLYKRNFLVSGGNYTTEMQIANDVHSRTNDVHFSRIFTRTNSIWEPNPSYYHERILHHKGQLDAMIHYVKDNPRRLALKRANPDLFRIRQDLRIGQSTYTALGKIFLADYPLRELLQCSRSLTQAEIATRKTECLSEAANGTVFVTAAISEGEKQIARALREAGFPLIILLTEGFPAPDSPHYRYFKPQGVYFEACAAGQLLLLEPQPDAFERPDIVAQVTAKAGDIPHDTKRFRFLALNALAKEISAPRPLS